MSQGYSDIPVTEKVYNSLSKLLERDETGLTCSSGTSFPQEIESWMIGRLCLRTDLQTLYYLSSVDPIVWTPMIDFSQELATKEYVDENYQPLSNNLTMLSNLAATADRMPYFTSADSMSTLPLTNFIKSIINAGSAQNVKTLLGLGSLSSVDGITSENVDSYISDSSLPVSKFDFTPITSGEGYTTGDIKESYNSDVQSDWIELDGENTIGSDDSGATYTGSTVSALYNKIWGNPAVTYFNSDGSSATKGSSSSTDWSANKRIKLPEGFNYINENCTYWIKK